MIPRLETDLDTATDLPHGMTHPEGTPCPFARDTFPTSPTGTCCSFDGQLLRDKLAAFGVSSIVEVLDMMDANLDAGRVLVVAACLRVSATDIERRYRGSKGSEPGTSMAGMFNLATGVFTPWPKIPIEEAIALIRKAADWFDNVGHLGCAVCADR